MAIDRSPKVREKREKERKVKKVRKDRTPTTHRTCETLVKWATVIVLSAQASHD